MSGIVFACKTSLEQSSHEPANPGPICFVSTTPPCWTSIQDWVDSRSLARCSQGELVKARGSKDVQHVHSYRDPEVPRTAREYLIYTSSDVQFRKYPHSKDFQGLNALHRNKRWHRPTHSSQDWKKS